LRHQADLRAADLRHLGALQFGEIPAAKPDLPFDEKRIFSQEAVQARSQRRLAGPRLADDRQSATLFEAKMHILQAGDDPGVGLKDDAEVAYLQQGRRGWGRRQ
jgi:hypothetical protein